MSQPKQNLYEGMYIVSATLSDDARQKAFDKIPELPFATLLILQNRPAKNCAVKRLNLIKSVVYY